MPFHGSRRNFNRRNGPEHVLTYLDSIRLRCESNKSATTFVTHVTWKTRDLVVAARSSFGNMLDGTGAGTYLASALVGSMIALTSAMELAGNPPCVACSRMICSFDAL